jgi:sarcosine oxidase subunit alpha
MAETITLSVDGVSVTVPRGAMISAAVAAAGVSAFRKSVTGEPRGPLCGMGVCIPCAPYLPGRKLEPHG